MNAEMPYIQICGKITHVEITGPKRKQRMVVDFEDDSGRIELIWFQGINWMSKKLRPDTNTSYLGNHLLQRGIDYLSSFYGRNDR